MIFTENKKVKHDYFIEKIYEAGIMLIGSEVKSIRKSECHLTDAWVDIIDNECFMVSSYIKKHQYAYNGGHDEKRVRKLLLHSEEINKLVKAVEQKGFTIKVLNLHEKNGLIKADIALCKGKHLYDKRESIKQADIKRENDRTE